MEDSDPKTPMLGKDSRGSSRSGRRGRLSRRYSVNSLRTEFVSRLPNSVRFALDLESSTSDLDLSRTSALSKGISLSVWFFDKINAGKIKEDDIYILSMVVRFLLTLIVCSCLVCYV